MDEVIAFLVWLWPIVMEHKVTAAVIGGIAGAARQDWEAFQTWQSESEAKAYDWKLARWRWFKGALTGLVFGLGWTALT